MCQLSIAVEYDAPSNMCSLAVNLLAYNRALASDSDTTEFMFSLGFREEGSDR
jgi:hypothetical protein